MLRLDDRTNELLYSHIQMTTELPGRQGPAGGKAPSEQRGKHGGPKLVNRHHHGWLWKLPACFGCRGAHPSDEGGGGGAAYEELLPHERRGGGATGLLEVAGRTGGVSTFQPLHYRATRAASVRSPAAASPAGAAVEDGGSGQQGQQGITDVWWWGVVSGAITAPREIRPVYEALDAWVAGTG